MQNTQTDRDIRATWGVRDGRFEDVDFAVRSSRKNGRQVRDAMTVAGLDNLVQAVIHRLKTVQGELAPLGHREYGSKHHELIGRPNTVNNRNLVKFHILQALRREERIEEVTRADILHDRATAPNRVTIALTLRFRDHGDEVDLSLPFSFTDQP